MDFETLMRGSRQQEDNTPMSETVARGQIATLKELHRSLNINEPFKCGDIIMWKDGLADRNYPKIGQYAIVEEILDDPVMEKNESSGNTYFRQLLDIKIGVLIDGRYTVFHVESRKFKKVKQA